MAQPPVNPTRIISANILPLPAGFNEPAVENVRETLEPAVTFDGKLRRTFLGAQSFPATNSGPLPTPTDPNTPVAIPGSTNAYFLDLAPGFETPMHRTVSADYLIVVSGSPTLVTPKNAFNVVDGHVDSNEAEETALSAGEVVVQRGQMHAWKNNTNEWVRLLGFIVDAKKIEVEVGTEKETKVLEEAWL